MISYQLTAILCIVCFLVSFIWTRLNVINKKLYLITSDQIEALNRLTYILENQHKLEFLFGKKDVIPKQKNKRNNTKPRDAEYRRKISEGVRKAKLRKKNESLAKGSQLHDYKVSLAPLDGEIIQ